MQLDLHSGTSGFQHSLLAGMRLFQSCDPEDIQDLLRRCTRRDVECDEVLIDPGNPNGAVYVVLSGSLEVRLGESDPVPISVIDSGECAGEMSIIEDRKPSAYVVATEPSHLLVIPSEYLWQLVNASHEFAKNLLIILSERVRHHNDFIANRIGEMRKFEEHATTDALTTLNNRHWMKDMFPRELDRCRRNYETASMMMIDVDRFKSFNDRFGHAAGDRVLTLVASELKNHFRPRDLIARFGGDEFVILLPGLAATQAAQIAERVRTSITGTSGDSDDSLVRAPVTVSIGISEMDRDDTLDRLIRKADAALYRAKEAGRNRIAR